jgi:hypothetical protein
VHLHGGRVWVEDGTGAENRFVVELPLPDADNPGGRPDVPGSPDVPGGPDDPNGMASPQSTSVRPPAAMSRDSRR